MKLKGWVHSERSRGALLSLSLSRKPLVFVITVLLIFGAFFSTFVFTPTVKKASAAGTRYWVGGSGNWSDTSHWSASSGGASGAIVPTSSDTIITNSASNATSYTITIDTSAVCAGWTWGQPASGSLTVSTDTDVTRSLTLGGNLTGTGTVILGGNSVTRRLFVRSSVRAVQRIITATVGLTFSNIDMQDMTSMPAGANRVIVAMGDSITAGAYPGNLQSLIVPYSGVEWSVLNKGVGGQDTPAILNRFNADVLSVPGAEYVVILAGFNDAYGDGGTATESNLQSMYTQAHNAGLKVVAVTMLPFKGNIYETAQRDAGMTAVNQWIKTTATNVDYVVDAYSVMQDPSNPGYYLPAYDSGDHIHPNAAGASFLASYIFSQVTLVPATNLWDISAIPGLSGDAGGNTRFTFTSSATQYYKSSFSAYWSDSARWFLGTNGTGGAGRVPLPQDDVRFDSSSFPVASRNVTHDMPRAGRSINWAGVINTPTWVINTSGAVGTTIYGGLTLSSGMTFTVTNYRHFIFSGRGTYYLTSNGKSFGTFGYLDIDTGTGTLMLGDPLNGGYGAALTLVCGTFDTNDQAINFGAFGTTTNAAARILNLRSSTISMAGIDLENSPWMIYDVIGLTVNSGTSTIKLTDSSSATKTFAGRTFIYNNIWLAPGSGTGTYRFAYGGNTAFANFKDDGTAAHSILFNGGNNTTVTSWDVSGTLGNLKTIGSITSATHTLTKSGGGTAICDYCSISNSIASPANTWYAKNSIDGGGNSGWIFDSTAPITTDNADTNWHNTPVTVTLSCTDTSGSGCATTYYTTDGTDPTTSSSSGNSIVLSTDGTYTIKYFSVDIAGNQESIKTASNQVKIKNVAPSSPPANLIPNPTISVIQSPAEIIQTVRQYVSTPYVYFSAPSAHAFDLPFTFDASDSFSAKGIAKYGWDFGDGATAEGMKVDHQYQSPGRYTVTLTVTDEAGKTATKQQTVDANPSKPTVEDISADGNDLVFKGKSYPKTIVHLEIHSNPISAQTTTDDNGLWTYKVANAKEVLGAGDHTVLASASYVLADQTQLKSEPSKTYDFKVSLDGDKLKVEMGKTKIWQYVSLGLGLILIIVVGFILIRKRRRII